MMLIVFLVFVYTGTVPAWFWALWAGYIAFSILVNFATSLKK